VVLPSVIGSLKAQGEQKVPEKMFVGREAMEHIEELRLLYPFDPRSSLQWDKATLLWDYLFTEALGVKPDQHPVLLTETPDMTKAGKLEMMEIFFEFFKVPSLYIANPCLMSLFATGSLTGCVVDVGNRLQILPVVEGFPIDIASYQLTKGVGDLTDHMARTLRDKGLRICTAYDMDNVRRLKESLCYIALDYQAELNKPEQDVVATYKLDNGQEVSIGSERFSIPEAIFSPREIGLDVPGLSEQAFECIMKSPLDSRRKLLSNIVLAGGSTSLPGFTERLSNELWALVKNKMPVARQSWINVVRPEEQNLLPWRGASVYANLNHFEEQCIYKENFEEQGGERLMDL